MAQIIILYGRTETSVLRLLCWAPRRRLDYHEGGEFLTQKIFEGVKDKFHCESDGLNGVKESGELQSWWLLH